MCNRMLQSDEDFHPTVVPYSQAHFLCPFGAKPNPLLRRRFVPLRILTKPRSEFGRPRKPA
jgi:hypothetical protein